MRYTRAHREGIPVSVPPSDPRTDAELVEALNRGDNTAFDTLYHRYRDWVASLARRFTGHDDDALDVLQETFAYLLRKTPDLRLTARMTTFLYPAVKHLAIAARRKRQRFLDTPSEAAEPEQADPAHAPTRADLAAVMGALPDDQREVVLMRFVDDMTLAEIAEALETPVGTVKSRLHRAIATLRDDPRTRRYFDVE